ncbi:hypothetical protein BO94DRAFT_622103 [Aspergillus sclerotioniger CBS 115572]|uniref:Uncharacterized protein n=1 Tax=Aspergillus sclerotioniger CBS 115572 TaxID=1450535 RepID=A0A317X573_9EURO|nr:hypothetical protein BO94DRAFT_622103 [Aspergillus sclerotioniger CBS 115572]PWY93746.1 hypothetical protein BO94DRAFT_622103 [Aspergillus sclerotioniger CBS 115572]
MAGKTLGRSSGSLNAPIAAFTMALLLGSYCISSIHTARREAQSASSTTTTPRAKRTESQSSWVQQALEESREEKGSN